MSVYVVHEKTRYEVPITLGTPIIAQDLLIRICTQLHLKPQMFALQRNELLLTSREPIAPFSVVNLILIPEDSSGNILSKKLWHIASIQTHNSVVQTVSQELFEYIYGVIHRFARLGLFEYTINLGEVAIWKDTVVPYLPSLANDIQTHIKLRFHNIGIYPQSVKEEDPLQWYFQWKISPEETIITKVTGRDLIQMGYNPSQDLFQNIMHRLRGAIIDGQVSAEFLEAQIQWVRSNFPLFPVAPRRR